MAFNLNRIAIAHVCHTVRQVFEAVVGRCIDAGLVGGESFSVDASLIRADVDQIKRVRGDEPIDWPDAEQASRAVAEYLSALDRDAREAGIVGPRCIVGECLGATWSHDGCHCSSFELV